MKLKSDFITYNANREALLVSTGKAEFSGLVKGNRTLGAILDLLKEDTDEASVIAAMQARFDAPAGINLEKGKMVFGNYELNQVIENGFTARPYELRVYLFDPELPKDPYEGLRRAGK